METAFPKTVPKCTFLPHLLLAFRNTGGPDAPFRYMRKVTDASRSIEQNFADPDVLGVYQLSKKVAGERMRVLQFMRFQKTADQTYFGIMEPIYNVYPLTIQHFQDRFADQAWIIYDARRRYGYYYDLKEVNEITFENSQADFLRHGKLQDELLDKNEKLFQEGWKSYFHSVCIQSRLNPVKHKKDMPVRFWKYLTEKD